MNLYIKELKNDIEFLEGLSNCKDHYRVFLPFLVPEYASMFFSEDALDRGLSMDDVYALCMGAKVPIPYLVMEERKKRDRFISGDFSIDKNENSTWQMCSLGRDLIRYDFSAPSPGKRYCIGIGHYKTKLEGQFHLCILLDLYDRTVASVSFDQSFEPVITELAISHVCDHYPSVTPIIHSSQNAIFKKKEYQQICENYSIIPSMTEEGTRGGIMPISTFFSGLMREKGGYDFVDVADGMEWLSCYIVRYNLARLEV